MRGALMAVNWWIAAAVLLYRGIPHLLGEGLSDAERFTSIVLIAVIAIGKSRSVLDRAAQRSVHRLESRPLAPIWNVYTIRLLALIFFMSLIGVLIRSTPYDLEIKNHLLAVLYPGIGLALLRSSRLFLHMGK